MIMQRLRIINMKMLPVILLGVCVAGCGGGGGSAAVAPPIIAPPAGATKITITAPESREDGSTSISLTEIESYRVYYGTVAGDYQHQVDLPPVANQTFDLTDLTLDSGMYYSVVTTVDSEGRESLYSAEVQVEI